MTPLSASLLFIIVSIIISTIKHFIFPSNSSTSSEQSSIQLKKLYTITDKKVEKQPKSYGSFYEAYHQFHISQIQQRKHLVEHNFRLVYNSLVMKKSIINDQQTVICDQNFLVTIQEGIQCSQELFQNQESNCDWQTTFNVYELPLLKQQTKQRMKIKGRIHHSLQNKNTIQSQSTTTKLDCKKVQQNIYTVDFSLSQKLKQSQENFWTLNKLQIKRHQNIQHNEKQKQDSPLKPSKLQVKSYDIPKISINFPKKQNNKSFQLSYTSSVLEKPYHIPSFYSLTLSGISYVTESEPWLIRYKNSHNQTWRHINILQNQFQKKIYEEMIIQSRKPPFNRVERVNIKHLFLYDSVQKIYEQQCEQSQCKQQVSESESKFLTVVYEHVNGAFRVEKFLIQLTFQLKEQQQSINSLDKLRTYSFLLSQIKPSRHIDCDCSLKQLSKRIEQRHYEKYYWLYEDKTIANIQINSLLCVFKTQIDENLRVIEIADIIRGPQSNQYYDLLFVDWKSLNKIINYKENFVDNVRREKLTNHSKDISSISNEFDQNTINKSQQLNDKNQIVLTQSGQFIDPIESQQTVEEMDLYLQIIQEEFIDQKQKQTEHKVSPSLNDQEDNESKGKDQNQKSKKKQKKSTQKKKKTNKKSKKSKQLTDKSLSKTQKNIKSKNKKYPNNLFSPVQGTNKPSILNSFNQSFYRQNFTYPINPQVRKFKFPLPFLLSFSDKMEIISAQTSKPLILFSGVKQYLFTYRLKQLHASKNITLQKVVDYRYLTLGLNNQQGSKIFSSPEGTPQHQIQTASSIIDQILQKTNTNPNQKLNIQIKDETHPEVQNVIKTIQQSDEKILNQIKSIKSVPVIYKKVSNSQIINSQVSYQKYLIVVWGWGIEVYLVDWDKNGFFRQNITQQEIELKLSQKNHSLIEYFLPFIELFATFYCIFQALISSR